MNLRLEYARMRGITEMHLEDLRSDAIFCVKADTNASSEIRTILENMKQVTKLFIEQFDVTCNGTKQVECIYEIVSNSMNQFIP